MGRSARRRDRAIAAARGVVDVPLPLGLPDPPPAPRAAPPAMASGRGSDPLADLRRLRWKAVQLEAQIDATIAAAVGAGSTYVEVGQALGVTRQAARQRHLRG